MEETILQVEEIEEAEEVEVAPSNEDFYRERYEALLAGVTPAALEDALTLARVRVSDEIDFKAALTDVLETYPVMKVKAAAVGFTGMKTGSKPPQVSGVEAAFIAKNPGIKL